MRFLRKQFGSKCAKQIGVFTVAEKQYFQVVGVLMQNAVANNVNDLCGAMLQNFLDATEYWKYLYKVTARCKETQRY